MKTTIITLQVHDHSNGKQYSLAKLPRTDAVRQAVEELPPFQCVVLKARGLTSSALNNALRQTALRKIKAHFSIARLSNNVFAVLRIR